MFDLILIGYLSYKNGTKAKLKGLNGIVWGLVTVMCYIVFMLIGFAFIITNFYANIGRDQLLSMDIKVREAATNQIVQSLAANPIQLITVEFFGVGGFLLIRYILDRKPNKKDPEIHWMDKIGEQ